eukprot:GSChrysophyteH1.ASY1.ANO1.40.1 assembled CDS
MSALLKIKAQKESFLSRLSDLTNEAESSAASVAAACANIQRVYRGRVDRAYIRFKAGKCTKIQCLFRGLLGRKKAGEAKAAKNENRVRSLFTYFAISLQRVFRGYYSRKYRSNHADRKKFIGDLEETGRKVREMMWQYSMDQAVREEQAERDKAEKDFKHYASNLHHLVSTKQMRGVFNPPEQFMEGPTWRDQPVEYHVRNTVRDLLNARGIPKTGLIVDMNGARKVPLKGLKSRLSLQASAPYDMEKKDRMEKQTLHKILTRDKGEFFAGGKTKIIDKGMEPLSTGDKYVDANLNPLLKKGVPESQRQLLESARTQKALFDPPLERPFYSRTGGNQSAAHDNGLFDIIGDALQSGGVTQRALGTSARFGIPDNCDNRPPGGVLPEPPIRSSTMRVSRPRINKLSIKAKAVDRKSVAMGLTGIADYGGRQGSPDDERAGGQFFSDGSVSPQGWDDGGNSPSNNMQQTNQEIVDPFASSDED